MKQVADNISRARAHDLRHQLTLMAVELSLARDRLRRGEDRPSLQLPSLLDQLDEGFARCRAILGEGVADGGRPAGDRGPLVKELWGRLLRAGRLGPDSARLEMPAPWRFPGSDEALYALLLNLLENACEAAGGGAVRLELRPGTISVENGGSALPESLARGLEFGGLPTPKDGRGHGLAEIRRRAGELDLEIRVQEDPSVRIMLSRRSTASILVVEDDDGLRGLLAELCRREGFEVDEAASFPIETAGGWDCVLADLGLPGEAGDRGLARVKSARPGTRTLLLTGDREACLRPPDGVDRAILKPGLAALREELTALREVTA